ncbi:MAG: sigma-70 family RNA polymerase sigma factor [Kiritimatiellia bacterium]
MQKGISLPGEMVLQLTQLQDDLYRHICVLCADVERAKDILQETNLEICAKYPTFDEAKGTFKAWCKTLATYQVRKALLYAKRDARRLVFDEDVFNLLVDTLAQEPDADLGRRVSCLQWCIGRLDQAKLRLIRLRYWQRSGVSEIARLCSLTESAVASRLVRIRSELADCVIRQECRLERQP